MKGLLGACLALALSGPAAACERCPTLPRSKILVSGTGWSLVSSSAGTFVVVEGPRTMTADDARRLQIKHRDRIREVRPDLNLGSGVRPELGVHYLHLDAHDFKGEQAKLAAKLATLVEADAKEVCVVFNLVEMKNVVYGPPPR